MTTAAQRLAEMLSEEGVRHVFGIPSGPWIPYMEALQRENIQFVLTANEAAAGFMADVTARITQVPGVCYATLGPGATNLTTGVGGALLDRSPVIALTTEPPEAMAGRTMQMGIDHQALYRPLTKWTDRLSPDRLEESVREAFRLAREEPPGPVHLGLPADLGDRPVEKTRLTRRPIAPPRDPDPEKLKAAAELFASARRPVLAAGLTAARLGLGPRVLELAEKFHLPVFLTPMAKGLIPENHPCYGGVLFHARSDLLAAIHGRADLVLGVGYDVVEFNYEDWLPEAPLIHLDTRPVDIDREAFPQVLDITGHPGAALAHLSGLNGLSFDWDLGMLADRRSELFQALAPPDSNVFGPRSALAVLRDVLPADGIMTCDVGAHTHLIGQMWPTPAPGLQIMTNGWSSMGFGLPAALAAKLARPDTPVVGVTGDGGFLMMAGEMATACRLGLDVVILVLVDRELSLIRVKEERKGLTPYGVDVVPRDYLTVGRLFGARVLLASSPETLKSALESAFRLQGPVVIKAVIDGEEYGRLIASHYK